MTALENSGGSKAAAVWQISRYKEAECYLGGSFYAAERIFLHWKNSCFVVGAPTEQVAIAVHGNLSHKENVSIVFLA